ncbi:Uncharacterised protein [Klebsiella pneumoniae]|nr:Uncharacterised protein [Klebsiella pneumoniae]VAX83741.1 Uncharacterised protein [Klebsiella pneumoniae]
MAQLHLIIQSQGILIPATPETSDFLQSKCKLGAVLEAEYKLVRNPTFHRKFFALLNLGFDYWEPTGGAIAGLSQVMPNTLLHMEGVNRRYLMPPGNISTE